MSPLNLLHVPNALLHRLSTEEGNKSYEAALRQSSCS